jgi:hypothetical protein
MENWRQSCNGYNFDKVLLIWLQRSQSFTQTSIRFRPKYTQFQGSLTSFIITKKFSKLILFLDLFDYLINFLQLFTDDIWRQKCKQCPNRSYHTIFDKKNHKVCFLKIRGKLHPLFFWFLSKIVPKTRVVVTLECLLILQSRWFWFTRTKLALHLEYLTTLNWLEQPHP